MTTKQVKMKLASPEQFLEIAENAINQLQNRADFKLVCKLCNIKHTRRDTIAATELSAANVQTENQQ